MKRMTNCHLIRRPPLTMKTAETMTKRSLTVACGRPEATEMWVLRCHSLVHHLGWQPQILHTISEVIFCKFSDDDTSWKKLTYCHQYYSGKGDDNLGPQLVTLERRHLFPVLILKTGHVKHDTFKEYWSRDMVWCAMPLSIPVSSNTIDFFTFSSFYITKTMAIPLTGTEKIMIGYGN